MAEIHAMVIMSNFKRIHSLAALPDSPYKGDYHQLKSLSFQQLAKKHPDKLGSVEKMFSFHSEDLLTGEEGQGGSSHMQMVSLGENCTVVQVPNPAFRPVFCATEEGKKTGVEILHNGGFRNALLWGFFEGAVLGDDALAGMWPMIRDPDAGAAAKTEDTETTGETKYWEGLHDSEKGK